MKNKINFGITCMYGHALFNLRVKISHDNAQKIKELYNPRDYNYQLTYIEKRDHYKFEGILKGSDFNKLNDELQDAMDDYKIEIIKLKTKFRKDYGYKPYNIKELKMMMDYPKPCDNDLPF